MATRGGAAVACSIWKHRRNPSLRSLAHRFTPNFNPRVIPTTTTGFRYQIRAIQGASADPVVTQMKKNKEEPRNWKIKMLYDGDCPLCMREVNMLMERNEKHGGAIKFVDISSNDYSPVDNQGVDYTTAMGQIHAVLSDGNVVTGVEAFRRLYEEVGLGWVYTITKFEPVRSISLLTSSVISCKFEQTITQDYLQIGKLADAVYDVWAKYRLQVTGRPPMEAILEARKKNKVETCGESKSCKM